MKPFFTLIIFSLVINFSFSQTGPGGVGNSTTNPYWIDVHTNGGTNGGVISSLTDYSGNGADAVQASAALQPTFIANGLNGVSAANFDGTDCIVSGANSALDGNQYLNYYVFSSINNTGALTLPFFLDYGSTGAENVFAGIITQSGLEKAFGHRFGQYRATNFPSVAGGNLYQGIYDVSNSLLTSKLNFNTSGSVLINDATPAVHENVYIGGTPSNYNTDALISEVFIFNTVLNTAEENILQNYISAKYGTAIGNDMYAFEGTHGFGVVGIGQDNASNNHLSSIGNGVVSITSGGISNGDYMFIGHDDVELYNSLLFDVPVSMTNAARLARVWRADETSDIGTITLVFDLDPISDFSADPNNYRLLIDHSDDDFSVVDLMLTGTYNAGTNSITFTNVDLASGDFFTLAGDAPQDVISITTGLWSQPTTWNCSCVPASFDKVTINAGHTVTLDVNSTIVDLTIKPTGVLTWNASEDLELSGTFNLSGTINMGATGELSMIGSDPQTIDLGGSSVDFTNVDISNTSSGVTINDGTFVLNGTLFPNSGGLDYSGVTFIVNSTSATTSGRIGAISGGFVLNGTANVRRFLPAGVAGNRNISSPVMGANLSNWDADISISGLGFPDGCAASAEGCYFSVKQYEANAYVDITDINESLNSGEGYEVFIGTDLTTFAGATITSTGTLRPSTDFVASIPKNGWSIQGNPYASPILFSTLQKQAPVGDYFYVYDPVTGGYQWYDGSSNTSSIPELANGLLAIGQGYWAFNSNVNTNYTITYTQSDKTSNTATFIRTSQVDESIYLTMSEEGTTYKCIVNVDFNERALDSHDSLDIMHLSTGLEKASSLMINSNGGMLRKQYLYNDSRDKTLEMSINILNEGYFTIDASNLDNLQRYSNVTLIDNFTGDVVNLKRMNSYTFYAYEGESQRFQLILSNRVVEDNNTSIFESSATGDELSITQIGNSINIESDEAIEGIAEINVYNLLGQEVVYSSSFEIEAGSNMMFLPSELKGMYLVVIKSVNGVQTKKIVL